MTSDSDSEKNFRELLAKVEKAVAPEAQAAIDARVQLRDAVCAFLLAESRAGTSIADVTTQVDAILKSAELANSILTDRGLAARLIAWCVGQHPQVFRQVM